MKKCISLFIIAIIILLGIEAVSLPINQAGSIIEKSRQITYEMNTITTNLSITYTSGFFGGVTIKNVGEYDATTMYYNVKVTYKGLLLGTHNGLFNTINRTWRDGCNLLAPGESYKAFWGPLAILRLTLFNFRDPPGFGLITVETNAYADNALPITASAEGIILFHFVFIK